MKEKIRDKEVKGKINISFKRGEEKHKWSCDAQVLLSQIQGIVDSYLKQGIRMTLRQLYYQLVAQDIIPNAVEVYKRLGTLVSDARYNGKIDWNAVEDRGRPQSMSSEWDNVRSLVDSAIASYRLPRWKDQVNYVELFTEKDALSSVLEPITEKYHIRLVVNKGYTSSSVIYELSKRLARKLKEGKYVKLLYLGDHDPSGLDMLRDINERLTELLQGGNEYIYPAFQIIPVALTGAQIRQYNPPPNPAKISDPRAEGYIQKYGNVSWEVDALKPEVMIGIVETAIQKQIDLDKYNAWIAKEREQAKVLRDFAETQVEDKEDKQEPYAFDSANLRTKVRVMKELTPIDDEDTIEFHGFDKGDIIFECPLCTHLADTDREMVYDHIFEDHTEGEFNGYFNGDDDSSDE
jgi:hypothetical protein